MAESVFAHASLDLRHDRVGNGAHRLVPT